MIVTPFLNLISIFLPLCLLLQYDYFKKPLPAKIGNTYYQQGVMKF